MTLPVLYSLRNCPFAMRARLAIFKSKEPVALREVNLKCKPTEMINASAKATVPIIVLPCSTVIDESLDVMLWALRENDPSNLLRVSSLHDDTNNVKISESSAELAEILALINQFDKGFKACLEAYKCAKRYHEPNLTECRAACEVYIKNLEQRLSQHQYVIDDNESMADIALLPFIRQFAKVERQWYLQSQYINIKRWLNQYLQSAMFTKVMAKYPLWTSGQLVVVFGDV